MLCLPDELLGQIIDEAAFGDKKKNLLTDYWATEVARFALCSRIHRISLSALVPKSLSLIVGFFPSKAAFFSGGYARIRSWPLRVVLGWLMQHQRAASTVQRLSLTVCARYPTHTLDKAQFVGDIDAILDFFPHLAFCEIDMSKDPYVPPVQMPPKFAVTLTSLRLARICMPSKLFITGLSKLSQLSRLSISDSELFDGDEDVENSAPAASDLALFEASFSLDSEQPPSLLPRLSHLDCKNVTVPLNALLAACPPLQGLNTCRIFWAKKERLEPGLVASLERLNVRLWVDRAHDTWEFAWEYLSDLSLSREALNPAVLPRLKELTIANELDLDEDDAHEYHDACSDKILQVLDQLYRSAPQPRRLRLLIRRHNESLEETASALASLRLTVESAPSHLSQVDFEWRTPANVRACIRHLPAQAIRELRDSLTNQGFECAKDTWPLDGPTDMIPGAEATWVRSSFESERSLLSTTPST